MIISRQVFYAQGCVGKLAALLHARRASREDGSSLLDCTRAPKGNMSACKCVKENTAKEEKGSVI